MTRMLELGGAAALLLLALPSTGLAYIDPGTGSYVLQLLIGGLFALLFALKQYWRRLKGPRSGGPRRHGKDS